MTPARHGGPACAVTRTVVAPSGRVRDDHWVAGRIGDLFRDEPDQWGGRGDPWLWRALRTRFADVPLPSTQGGLEALLRRAFAAEVGHAVSDLVGVGVYVERFAHGGMSSGYVSLTWWSTTGIPLLLCRAALPGALFSIRRTSEQDWLSVREIRLENAEENPVSYGADLRTTLAMTEDDWRTRARRGTGSDTTNVVAVADDGPWLGIMAAQLCGDGVPQALLTGVFVRAAARGRTHGVADALLAEVLAWAVLHAPSIHLWVDRAPAGAPARRFYARHGFRPTGRRRPAAGFPDAEIEEMTAALELPDQP